MIKNIFLDRDGIVNEVMIRNNKIESPRFLHEFKILDDFIEIYNVLKAWLQFFCSIKSTRYCKKYNEH